MKLWRFSDPCDYRYARATLRGTWEGTPARRVRPLVIEWEADAGTIGDFVWPGFDSDIAVSDRVAEVLRDEGLTGFELAVAQVKGNRKHKSRRSPRTSLSAGRPRLWDLWVVAWATTDLARSTVQETRYPDGTSIHQIAGVERRESTWDQEKLTLHTVVHPRVEGCGLWVDARADIFRVREFPKWVFCNDKAKQRIEAQQLTNVGFLEMGEVRFDYSR